MADLLQPLVTAQTDASKRGVVLDIYTPVVLDIGAVEDAPVDKSTSTAKDQHEHFDEVTKSLATYSKLLGFTVGILCNLAGFGGENLFALILVKNNVAIFVDDKPCTLVMVVTVGFWSLFTTCTLLAIRSVFLSMTEKVLGLVSPAINNGCGGKEGESSEDGTTEIETAGLEYLDHKFLSATLFGSLSVALITNVFLGTYLSGVLGVLGLVGIAIYERCVSRCHEKALCKEESV